MAAKFPRTRLQGPGATTPDREFSLETVNCLGACALGPIVVIDGQYHPEVNTDKARQILEGVRTGTGARGSPADTTALPVKVSCPRCNHSLMNAEHFIDGQPSIHVTMSYGQVHGWLRLSAMYGSFAIEAEHDIPMNTVVDFFCPHCHGELAGASDCSECGARMVPLLVRGGGIVQICAHRGCRSHRLDVSGTEM